MLNTRNLLSFLKKETEYKIEPGNDPNVILISFHTTSKFKYRLDIYKIEEFGTIYNHIAFSDYYADTEDNDSYEGTLDRNEMVEIMNRIHYILKDLIKQKYITRDFCIGETKYPRKNKIYDFIVKVLNPIKSERKKTDQYDTGYGLYFSI